MDHVVDFHAVNQLGIIAHFSLNFVKFGIKLLQVRESPQMHALHIVANVLVAEKVLHDLVAKLDLLQVCSWLLEPLFEQSSTDLSPRLVQ